MTFLNFYLLCVIVFPILIDAAADCLANPFQPRAPFLIRPETNENTFSIIYPDFGENVITFNAGDTLEFACPYQEVIYNEIRTPTTVKATCTLSGRFEINGKRILFEEIFCSDEPRSTARLLTSRCGIDAILAEVGFDIGRNRFLIAYFVCFDQFNEIPLYTRHTIISNINFGYNTKERPFFTQDDGFYRTTSVDNLYTRHKHRMTINRLIGLPDTSTKYIQNDYRFLSRGHLVAKKDFFYKPYQMATFRMINVAPQWQTFNGFNWNQVEIDTRNYANNYKLNLEVCTGIFGVDTLPHESNNQNIPLCLLSHGNQRALPVPALFWKIVYDRTNNRGIVLIGLNNPYKRDAENIICSDISNQISWLTWDKFNIQRGYSYACTITSFRYAVQEQLHVPDDIPDLGLSELLI